MNQGWECPKCGAVMGPSAVVCVNCIGQPLRLTSSDFEHPKCKCVMDNLLARPAPLPLSDKGKLKTGGLT